MYNPDFNSPEFEGIKNEAGLNRFILSVKQWVEKTNSKGIIAKAGRYGVTYAHKDIAFDVQMYGVFSGMVLHIRKSLCHAACCDKPFLDRKSTRLNSSH